MGDFDEQPKVKIIKDSDEEDDGSLPDDLPMGHQELHYPEISEVAQYLVSLFHSAGMASPTGMGLVGLSYQEIESWANMADMQGIIKPWQCVAIYTMSRAYASECTASQKKGAKTPYTPEIEEVAKVDREIVNEQIEDVFASLIASQKRS